MALSLTSTDEEHIYVRGLALTRQSDGKPSQAWSSGCGPDGAGTRDARLLDACSGGCHRSRAAFAVCAGRPDRDLHGRAAR